MSITAVSTTVSLGQTALVMMIVPNFVKLGFILPALFIITLHTMMSKFFIFIVLLVSSL